MARRTRPAPILPAPDIGEAAAAIRGGLAALLDTRLHDRGRCDGLNRVLSILAPDELLELLLRLARAGGARRRRWR
jgi:hypothetical protein